MEDWMILKLESQLRTLSRNFNVHNVLIYLRVHNVFDYDDYERIRNNALYVTDEEKRVKIIDNLKRRGTRAYWVFCHAIQTRCPEMFRTLHDDLGNNHPNRMCVICNGEEQERQCDYCTGLVSTFSHLDHQGTYIERVEDLLDYFTNVGNRVQEKDSQIAALVTQIANLKSEKTSLEGSRIDLNRELATTRADFKRKERECREAQGVKHTYDMRINTLEINVNDYCQRLNDQIELCEEYRSRCEDAEKKLEQQIKSPDDDPIYANREVYFIQKTQTLTKELEESKQQTTSLKKEFLKLKEKASQLEIQKEQIESLYEDAQREHTRERCILEQEKNDLARDNEELKDRSNDMDEQMLMIRKLSEESGSEKEHLVNTLYDKNRQLNEANDNLKQMEKDREHLSEMYQRKNQRCTDLETRNAECIAALDRVAAERDDASRNRNEMVEIRDSHVKKMFDLEKKSDAAERKIDDLLRDKRQIVTECQALQDKIKEMTQPKDTDHVVLLRRASRESRFGISFAKKEGKVMINESQIKISHIDQRANAGPFSGIKIGDNVISMNDINVTNSNLSHIQQILSKSDLELKLVLRSPYTFVEKCYDYKCNDKALRQMLQASAVISLGDCPESRNSLKNGDRIEQINHKNVSGYSLDKINERLKNSNEMTLKIIRKEMIPPAPQHRQSQFRRPSQFNADLPTPPVGGRTQSPPVGGRTQSRTSSLNSSINSNHSLQNNDGFHTPPPYGYRSRASSNQNDEHMKTHHLSSSNFDGTIQEDYNSLQSRPPPPQRQPSNQYSRNLQTETDRRHSSFVAPSPPSMSGNPPTFYHHEHQRSDPTSSSFQPSQEPHRTYAPSAGIHSAAHGFQCPSHSYQRSQSVEYVQCHAAGGNSPPTPTRERVFSQLPMPVPDRDLTNEAPYTVHQANGYDAVITPGLDDQQPTRDERFTTDTMTIVKGVLEELGIEIIGGNKIGIFVLKVLSNSIAARQRVKKGWKILKINNQSMEKVAFCFAYEYFKKKERSSEEMKILFEHVPANRFEEILQLKPYDSFHVRALKDHTGHMEQDLSFEQGQTLMVQDSHVSITGIDGQSYCWKASVESDNFQRISGHIPRQIGVNSHSTVEDHVYSSADDLDGNILQHQASHEGILYTILDPVGEHLVTLD
ncbi:myosin-11-like [Clytia hemisphaerica]|uniref:Uncharacterized protein n=1 Tax=Clytia hemisphaerica TaxID=252671 RepID=A0A7M5WMZ2_9CNID